MIQGSFTSNAKASKSSAQVNAISRGERKQERVSMQGENGESELRESLAKSVINQEYQPAAGHRPGYGDSTACVQAF